MSYHSDNFLQQILIPATSFPGIQLLNSKLLEPWHPLNKSLSFKCLNYNSKLQKWFDIQKNISYFLMYMKTTFAILWLSRTILPIYFFYHPAYMRFEKMRRNWNMQSLLPIFQCSHCHHNLYKVRYTVPVVHTYIAFSIVLLFCWICVSDGFVSTQAIILTEATLNHDLPSSHFVHIWNFMCAVVTFCVLRRYKFSLM